MLISLTSMISRFQTSPNCKLLGNLKNSVLETKIGIFVFTRKETEKEPAVMCPSFCIVLNPKILSRHALPYGSRTRFLMNTMKELLLTGFRLPPVLWDGLRSLRLRQLTILKKDSL
ncbi:PREDICTED: uncharacterized protein LOC105954005 [Erythranthe guttata]|uniref:uncharacterized protein LOC105954005 n=1 Tax=Erythranthe guttata TaxID=4155 RepID=UPI00064DAC99|nr:PREDICTED: uncharacterized protein LOC105954005 [Erythranthe guttata]|eukprot:XP_012833131.1 PREDICTED: uncharacterized protein LOC105954005 [Erythranthe guttata]